MLLESMDLATSLHCDAYGNVAHKAGSTVPVWKIKYKVLVILIGYIVCEYDEPAVKVQ